MARRREPTESEKWRQFLMQYRCKMQIDRFADECATIYAGAGDVLCSRKRSHASFAECQKCRWFENIFWHCTYQETEPIDMRKWKLVERYNAICSAATKEGLGKMLQYALAYRMVLERLPKPHTAENKLYAAGIAREAEADFANNPLIKIADKADGAGYYPVLNPRTGARLSYLAIYRADVKMWTAVEYLPPEVISA